MRILYIDIDTLRPDHLGCYGYHRDTSPNIDAVAERGTRFTNVYASDVPCLPSRTALVTGTFGIRNGVNNHGGAAADLASRGADRGFFNQWVVRSLPSVLGLAGLRTASISSFPLRHGAMWWSAGFSEAMNLMRGIGGERADEVAAGSVGLARSGRRLRRLVPARPLLGSAHAVQRAGVVREPVRRRPDPGVAHRGGAGSELVAGGPALGAGTVGVPTRRVGRADLPHALEPRRRRRRHHDVRRLRRRYPLRRRRRRPAREQARRPRRARRHDHLDLERPRRGVRRARRVRRPPGRRRGDGPHPGDRERARHRGGRTDRTALPPRRRGDGRRARRRPAASIVGRRVAASGRDDRVPTRRGASSSSSRRVRGRASAACASATTCTCAPSTTGSIRTGATRCSSTSSADPHEQDDLAADRPAVVADARAQLAGWLDEQLARSYAPQDPLATIAAEGGPFHVRGHLDEYLERLRATGREEWIAPILDRHGLADSST